MSSEREPVAPEESDVPENDDVVGKAMRLSLLLVAVIVIAVGGLIYFRNSPDETAAQVEAPTTLPQVRERPELQIPSILFTDTTIESGLDFVHENGAAGQKLLPETMTGGCAFFDFDSDGDQDIICVSARPWKVDDANDESATSALYENDGNGNFSNVTAGSGLDVSFYGNGVACGDYDNDGLVDLYITAVGPNRLFHNEGNGRFKEVTDQARVAGPNDAWGTSCGWFDYDRDGDLDLFVCNYIEWSPELDLSMEFTLDGTLRAYGRPTDFRGVFPILYRNDGTGQFSDVSEETGIQIVNPDTDEPLAKSLGLTFTDVNSDGHLDVVVANDTVQNLLLQNDGAGHFADNGAAAGIAFDNSGQARGAMGIDAAFFRNSDAVGISIGNFSNEMTALYVCQTPGLSDPVFRDEAVSNGIGPVTRVELTFGVLFADVDLDGRLDIFACNGHLEEDIKKVQARQHYEQPPQLLWNCGPEHDSEFVALSEAQTGSDFARPMVGRGASRADIDGDGDLDLLLMACGGRPRLLRNDQSTGHHWLRLKLNGTESPRDAIGAVVRATLPDGTVLTQVVMPTCSYQSQAELPLTFGLGQHDQITLLEISWPSGRQQKVSVDAIDQLIEIDEPAED